MPHVDWTTGTTFDTESLRVENDALFGTTAGASALVGFYGSAGTTQAATYTTAAITTGRVFPSTAGLTTFTGVSGVGATFATLADFQNFVRVVHQMYQDLKSLGLLR